MKKPLTVMLSVALFGGAVAGAFGAGIWYPTHKMSVQANPSSVHPVKTAALKEKVYYKNKVIVLMYHDLADKVVNDKSLTQERFDKQMSLMKKAGFNWITMEQYVDFQLRKGEVPPNAVLLTFDDGYESFYNHAYPVLKKYDAPATEFVIVSTVDNPKAIGIQKLTWDQVNEMQANKISFYNHSFNSHIKYAINPKSKRQRGMLASPMYLNDEKRSETKQEYIDRITADLKLANEILDEKTGNKDHVIAFPYGDFSKELLDVCNKLDMKITFTVKRGINSRGMYNGYRLNAAANPKDPNSLIKDMEAGVPNVVKTSDCYSRSANTMLASADAELLNGEAESADEHGHHQVEPTASIQSAKACEAGTLAPVFPNELW